MISTCHLQQLIPTLMLIQEPRGIKVICSRFCRGKTAVHHAIRKNNVILHARMRDKVVVAAEFDDGVAPKPATLPAVEEKEVLVNQARELGGIIQCWLDDEWTPLDSHKEIGDKTTEIYVRLRETREEIEVGDIVLGLSQGLLESNHIFADTFVNAFEVANKCVEVLMLADGCDVCCVSDNDLQAIQRYRNEVNIRYEA